MKINRNSIAKAVESLLETGARQAICYQHPKLVIKATRRHKPHKRARTTEIMLTIGAPNYECQRFIKRCLKAGEPFPVRRVQLKFYTQKSNLKRK